MITKRIKELLEIYNDASDDEKQAYLIQLRTYLQLTEFVSLRTHF